MKSNGNNGIGPIATLLRLYFDDVSIEPVLSNQARPDFLVKGEGKILIVEFKLFRSRRIGNSQLMLGVHQLLKYSAEFNNPSSKLLIVACVVDEQQKSTILKKFGVIIWDIGILLYLSAKDPNCRSQIEEILRQTTEFSEGGSFDGIVEPNSYDPQLVWKVSGVTHQPIESGPNSDILIENIKGIKPGREKSLEFEKRCTEALRYVFADHLSGWNEQNRTNDTLHRFDLVCRVSSTYDYWRMLTSYLQSWYIVFEFKNYEDPITQEQIYTTEKYLFRTALRSIAFIISPKGCDKNANKAMEGALKEQGKLIISLTVDQLVNMIQIKAGGEEPTDFLIGEIDRVLLSLSR